MNPVSQAAQKDPSLTMRDVVPPITQPKLPAPPATLNPEVIQNIPVKNQIDSVVGVKPLSSNNPITQVSKPINDSEPGHEDKELDMILKDVNSSVKRTENSLEERFEHLSGVRKKTAIKKAKINEAQSGSPPILATAAALAAAAILIAAALMMFSTE